MPHSDLSDIIPSSFRDPSGAVFRQAGSIYRQINLSYKENYDLLMESGLYSALVKDGLLIPHREVAVEPTAFGQAYKTIQPEIVPFISYPYEWCFSQLRDAALLTLKVQKLSVGYGISLKDCSAYNIQFRKGKPVLIDTLSFERYHEGRPWVAYRQFCQHFLAPLALMAYKDVRLNQLSRVYIDGIPLDVASQLLPLSTRFRFSLLSHIHLHAKSQEHFAEKTIRAADAKISRHSLLGLIDNLESIVRKLRWLAAGTEWGDYYQDTNYSPRAFDHKKQLVGEFLDKIRPRAVWDLGANTGVFSRIASDKGIPCVSFDVDPVAVERNYLQSKTRGETNILPLLLDLTNPSPGIGWENQERASFLQRGPADAVMALALIHHLAISNNLPLNRIAEFFAGICASLIIEFVPKTDSQVQRLLATREDIFPDYTVESFEAQFGKAFKILHAVAIEDSQRRMYLMTLK